MDGQRKLLLIPEVKRCKAYNAIQNIINKKKAMVKQIQSLAGLLNFMCKAIFLGRAFTRQMYANIKEKLVAKDRRVKHFHHINLSHEFRNDCLVWLQFLSEEKKEFYFRPIVDISEVLNALEINMYTDASKKFRLRFGGIYDQEYFFGKWEDGFIRQMNPSIEYLELYAVCMAVFIWVERLRDLRIQVHGQNVWKSVF